MTNMTDGKKRKIPDESREKDIAQAPVCIPSKICYKNISENIYTYIHTTYTHIHIHKYINDIYTHT